MLATRTEHLFCGPAVAALALVLAFIPQAAWAQDIQGTLSNFDVWNYCGDTANDFHVILEGVRPEEIGEVYTGRFGYPDFEIIDTGTGSKIVWTGSETPIGSFAHFGFDLHPDANPECFDFCWTRDGEILCCAYANKQDWLVLTEFRIGTVINSCGGAVPRWIQRRISTQSHAIVLDDLIRGETLWNEATLVDQVPTLLESGTLEYNFEYNGDLSYIMMYDVFEDDNGGPGNLIATFLNAAIVVLEDPYALSLSGSCPGTVSLAWSGAPPGTQQGIVFARDTGNFTINGGPCAGTQLGLGTNQLRLYSIIPTGNGSGSVNAQASPSACGGFIQLVAVGNPCRTSNVAQVP